MINQLWLFNEIKGIHQSFITFGSCYSFGLIFDMKALFEKMLFRIINSLA